MVSKARQSATDGDDDDDGDDGDDDDDDEMSVLLVEETGVYPEECLGII